jgi:hypothetical protein
MQNAAGDGVAQVSYDQNDAYRAVVPTLSAWQSTSRTACG